MGIAGFVKAFDQAPTKPSHVEALQATTATVQVESNDFQEGSSAGALPSKRRRTDEDQREQVDESVKLVPRYTSTEEVPPHLAKCEFGILFCFLCF